jgi:hypothetical protein
MAGVVLRNWQVECRGVLLADFLASLSEGVQPNSSIGACVGAGKSTMMADTAYALTCGDEGTLAEICPADLVVIVAPNRGIIGETGGLGCEPFGIIGALLKYGLWPLERITGERLPGIMAPPDLEINDAGLITGAVLVVTYQYLAQRKVQDTLIEWARLGKRIALFCDEVHHAPHAWTAWAEAVARVKAVAVCFISWSGTWYRTDRRAIIGQDAEDRPSLTYCYPYARGIQDGHVRPVSFWIPDTTARTFDEASGTLIDERPVSTYLESLPPHVRKEMFDPDGWFVDMMIRRADYELGLRRPKYPDAGCLVACPPGFHEEGDEFEDRVAKRIYDRLLEITGKRAVLILNGDPVERIAEYRESDVPYLVAVNRILEGCDLPRLRMALLLRDLSGSELLFEQLIGRIIRRRPEDDEQPALCIMPPIHAMCEYARNITIAEKGAIPKIVEPCGECHRLPCVCPCSRCGKRRPCKCPCPHCGQRPCICQDLPGLSIFAKLLGIHDNHITQGTDIEDPFAERALDLRQRYGVFAHRDLADMALLLQLDAQSRGEQGSARNGSAAPDQSQLVATTMNWKILRDGVPVKVTQLQRYFRGEKDGRGRFRAAWGHVNRKFFDGLKWKDVKDDPAKLTFEKLKEIHAYLDRTIKGNTL